MEKIVKTLFVVASVTLSMGSFVSCKDYNEDLRTELKSDISKQASLQDALQAQLNSLKSTLDGIKSCECDLTKYLTKQEAASTYLTQASIQAYLDQVAANKTAIEMLQSAIDAINAQLAGLGDKSIAEQLNDVNVTIMNVSSIANEALELAKNAGKCECNLDELKQQIATLEGLVAGWDEKLTEVNKKAADAMAKAEENATWIEKNKETIEALKKLIEDNKVLERLETIESSYMKKDDITALVNEAKEAAKAANDLAKKAMAQAESNSGKIGELEETVKKIGELEEAVKTLVSTEEFQTEIAKLDTAILGLAVIVEAIDAELVKIKADLTSMITGIIAQTTANPVLGYINTPFGVNQYMLATYYGDADNGIEFPARDGRFYLDASDVETWTPRNLQVMGISSLKQIEGYFTKQSGRFVADNNGDITGNAGTIYLTVNPSNVNFSGQLLSLETSAQNVAPITLSPLEPSNEELEFGIYRNWTRSEENGFYAAKATLSLEDIDKVKTVVDINSIKDAVKSVLKEKSKTSLYESAAQVLNSFSGNRYPAYGMKASWTDMSNGQVHNIYSQYNIAVTAIKPLSFAFMKDAKVENVPGIDKIRNFVGKIVDKINVNVNLGLPDFAKYKGSITFKDIKLPTIDDEMLRITYHKTYTSDDLAGIGKLYGDAKDVDLYFLVTNVKDGRYALVGTNADGSEQKLYIYDPATSTYHLATPGEEAAWGAIQFELTVDVDINKTEEVKDVLDDIIASVNSQFGANSDLSRTITDLLNDVSSLGDIDTKISDAIDDAKADIKSTLNDYITRVNNKLVGWLNSAHKVLYITMLGNIDDKVGLLSQSLSYPTKAKAGQLKLIPTTYSLQYFAPIYKKFVAVTNVYDAKTKTELDLASAKAAAAAANSGKNMMKVVDGLENCSFNGEAGKIYELTYTAVDYLGVVMIRRYYVEF